jgi:hypothetical protein
MVLNRLDEARLILEAIRANRFALRGHAIRRGDERSLSRESVMKVAASVIGWKYQEEKYSHVFIGFLDGEVRREGGGFSAVLDGEGVGVVTVFKRHLSRGERERAEPGAALREGVL